MNTHPIASFIMKGDIFNQPSSKLLPSRRDLFSLFFVLSILLLIAWTCSQLGGTVDYKDINNLSKYSEIPLDMWNLPSYAADTVVRMFIALFFSLLASFIFGAWAAKSKRAEQ